MRKSTQIKVILNSYGVEYGSYKFYAGPIAA